MKMFDRFIKSFADETGLPWQEAKEQWAAFSYQLSDSDREAIELGGSESGYSMARRYNAYYGRKEKHYENHN